jgi:hypothetical protein
MNFFDHKDLGNHLLQLCPKVVKHPVYIRTSILWSQPSVGSEMKTVTWRQGMWPSVTWSGHLKEWRWKNDFLFSWLYRPLWSWSLIFQFMIILQTVGLFGRVISSSQGLCLNTGQHTHRINAYTYQTSMTCVGFEYTIPASERAKTVHAEEWLTGKSIWRKTVYRNMYVLMWAWFRTLSEEHRLEMKSKQWLHSVELDISCFLLDGVQMREWCDRREHLTSARKIRIAHTVLEDLRRRKCWEDNI